MLRGQAFEVFRLLIAAVVAGVVLMTLLGIINTLIVPTQNPQQAAQSLVEQYSKYGGKGVSDVITFTPNSSIYLPAVAAHASMDKDCVIGAVTKTLRNTQSKPGKFQLSDDLEYIEYIGRTPFKARIQVVCMEPERSTSGIDTPKTIENLKKALYDDDTSENEIEKKYGSKINDIIDKCSMICAVEIITQ